MPAVDRASRWLMSRQVIVCIRIETRQSADVDRN